MEGGYWEIVNGEKYQEEMRSLTARVRKTRLQRERRAAKREHEEGAPKRKEILRGSGKLAERLRVQAEKNGDAATVKRLDEMEAGVNPAAAEFREKFNRTLAQVQAEQTHPLMPLPPDEVKPPEPEPTVAEGAEGESFPEV